MDSLLDTFPHMEDEEPCSLRKNQSFHLLNNPMAENNRPDIILPFRDPVSGRFGLDTRDDAEK